MGSTKEVIIGIAVLAVAIFLGKMIYNRISKKPATEEA